MADIELNLPRVPVSVARARASLRPLRSALGDRHQDAVLLVSELVSNAVRHGHGATVGLVVQLRDERLRVEVVDGGNGFLPPTASELTTSAMNGRGLPIVNALSDGWGVYEGNSTHVWFEIDISDPPDEPDQPD
jgi:anti-sigma regulatory factor (Ser/Thr protein kinase)